ncbi:type II secretion system F family protein [Salinibacterium sp. SYSU T00001]|uniref:type II secretion system F family protein n=1 Tax=Homoserinimonas sedimenticola TaxID=2986805 RepID=UPI0022354A8C|nr:type II secretion system F family protein [Salinibacterium sedimenticola]MCW4385426.1 type II secretion system F family protein [Salinibacterium sedimenticola]
MGETSVLLLGVAALALGLFGLLWVLLGAGQGSAARGNLERGIVPTGPREEVARGARPGATESRLPAATVARLARYAEAAGRPPSVVTTAVTLKFVLAAFGLLLALLIGFATRSPLGWIIGLAIAVLAWFAPEIYLQGRAGDRRKVIDAALADTLDQLTIAVEAGLGFEAALVRIVRNGRGPLNDELARTLQSLQLGVTRREAYRALADRVDLPDLDRFVRAIIQADAYGVPIAGVLRQQSAEVRMRRRQRLEEQAQTIPVKVTFPLMLCLMPVLFIMILGPVLINALGGL